MTYRVKLTLTARKDVRRLFEFLAEKDIKSAWRSFDALERAFEGLTLFPYSCRKIDPDDPSLRELLIPFGGAGYAASFRIVGNEVRILSIRHQLEEDYQ